VKKSNKKTRLKGISRIDQVDKNIRGWYVRVYFQGKTWTSKFFSDKKYGGKVKALEASKEFRENGIELLKKKYPDFDRLNRRRVSKAKSNTGTLGVSRVTYYDHRRDKYYDCYSVSWRPEAGKSKVTKISINKYGDKKAFKMACKLRKEKETEIYGTKKRKV